MQKLCNFKSSTFLKKDFSDKSYQIGENFSYFPAGLVGFFIVL
ncbi:hypothetical protein LEP1GSC050_3593 [Leptospira broomii serovar Hurstbridge str. 5399]|uniref:Uncharacterized protein n=1 Tax=Leptospira broomii serovar Hurstbridge str. 5399 TaxID=1049789 RepID=T0GIG6_9LEPT|nr:hypothetical protein LEP1GSC050_3593 [Leptospira broomii serovar Hurstbridge str. 5399]